MNDHDSSRVKTGNRNAPEVGKFLACALRGLHLHTGSSHDLQELPIRLAVFAGLLALLGCVPRVPPGAASPPGTPPAQLLGDFQDDYGNDYHITPTEWVQQPHGRFHIVAWVPEQQYLIAQNDPANRSDPGLWTRIDWLDLPGMAPYNWAFCLSAYRAASRAEAEATAIARRETPRTGCNGFPFSRMRSRKVTAVPASVQAQAPAPPACGLLGTWRLMEFTDWDSAGRAMHLYGDRPRGYLIYTATGQVSVYLMEDASIRGGIQASYVGAFATDSACRVVIHTIEGSSDPTLIGTAEPRPFRLSGDTLTIGDGRTWRRVFMRIHGKPGQTRSPSSGVP